MPRPRAIALQNARDLRADACGAGEQRERIEIALQRHPVTDARAGLADVGGPVETQRVAAGIGHRLQLLAAVLGEQDHRHVGQLRLQARDDAAHGRQRELPVAGDVEHAAPGVEHHQRIGTGGGLGFEVDGDAVGERVEQFGQQFGRVEAHLLDAREFLATLPLDHVGRKRPGRAGEADQRAARAQRRADGAHGVHNVAQLAFGIGHAERADGRCVAYRAVEHRPLALDEAQTEPHRVGDGEDVAEQDRRIETGIAVERLQGDLAAQLRIAAQRHEITRLRATGAVLGQVAAGLAHHPDWRAVHRLALEGAQETIVVELPHAASAPAISVWIASAIARGSAASRIGRPITR